MLKSFAAIFLIGILSFNWYGFDLWVKIQENRYDEQLELAFDNNTYDTSQIIELDSKIVLPYVADWKDFERVDGEVLIEGVYYKFFERKYENGRIIYRCIPNTDKIKLHHSRSIFFELMNEMQAASNHQKPASGTLTVKKTISDYELQRSPGLNCSIKEFFPAELAYLAIKLTDVFFSVSSPPPEIV